jgi:hypothetical protein
MNAIWFCTVGAKQLAAAGRAKVFGHYSTRISTVGKRLSLTLPR